MFIYKAQRKDESQNDGRESTIDDKKDGWIEPFQIIYIGLINVKLIDFSAKIERKKDVFSSLFIIEILIVCYIVKIFVEVISPLAILKLTMIQNDIGIQTFHLFDSSFFFFFFSIHSPTKKKSTDATLAWAPPFWKLLCAKCSIRTFHFVPCVWLNLICCFVVYSLSLVHLRVLCNQFDRKLKIWRLFLTTKIVVFCLQHNSISLILHKWNVENEISRGSIKNLHNIFQAVKMNFEVQRTSD